MHKYNNEWKPLGWLPSGEEISDGVGDVAGHAHHNGPFAAQIFDHDGRQEHGGDDDGGVDDTQGRHPHPLLCIQTALHRQRQESVRWERALFEKSFNSKQTTGLNMSGSLQEAYCYRSRIFFYSVKVGSQIETCTFVSLINMPVMKNQNRFLFIKRRSSFKSRRFST